MKIELRPWSEFSLSLLAETCHNVDRTYLSGRLPYPYTEDDAKWWLENVVLPNDGRRGLFRAIVADGKVVGNITIEPKEDIRRRDCEIGYFVSTDYHGRGIATEATRMIIELAFDTLDIDRITSEVFLDNIASQRVLQKNGFSIEGTLRRAAYKNGRFFDIVMFGLLRDERKSL